MNDIDYIMTALNNKEKSSTGSSSSKQSPSSCFDKWREDCSGKTFNQDYCEAMLSYCMVEQVFKLAKGVNN